MFAASHRACDSFRRHPSRRRSHHLKREPRYRPRLVRVADRLCAGIVTGVRPGSDRSDGGVFRRFRGSVAALDAATGKEICRGGSRSPRSLGRTKKSLGGTQLWGPAGAAVWTSPTIDVKRRQIYVGTGNAYTEPAASTSNSILALDLATGTIRWSRQLTPDDVFVLGCPGKNTNCPEKVGPDFDIGSSPILRTLPGGRDILIVGQKSGVAFGLDPDREGATVWQSVPVRVDCSAASSGGWPRITSACTCRFGRAAARVGGGFDTVNQVKATGGSIDRRVR